MKYPFAIMDYGIGGLGLYQLIKKDFPDFSILYFSDSGVVPYGKQNRKVLRARVLKVIAFLHEQGAEKIIVACHSASSVILPSDKNVISLRQATIDAVVKARPKRLGILGGSRTIRSGYYRDELTKRGIDVKQSVAQTLSILIERGEVNSDVVHAAVKKIVSPLNDRDTILLACTHYPAVYSIFREHLGKDIKIVDPVEELYSSIKKRLTSKDTDSCGSVFLTTGNARLMKAAAAKAFSVRLTAKSQKLSRFIKTPFS